MIIIKIFNSGNVSIRKEDFDDKKGIKILFKTTNNQFKILSAQIAYSSSISMTPQIHIEAEEVIIQPSIWNEDDFIVVKLLVSEYKIDDKITATAHIFDIKHDLINVSQLSNFSDKVSDFIFYWKERITLSLSFLGFLFFMVLIALWICSFFLEKIPSIFNIVLLINFLLIMLLYI